MFTKPIEIHELSKKGDDRGQLFEMMNVPNAGYIYTFTIKPGKIRGNHFHEKKQEWFTCVQGRVTVYMETKEGISERHVLDAQHPQLVYNDVGVAHAFVNESDELAIMVAYGSHRHNPANPDTIKKDLR